jgi:hypothetical protein
MVQAKKKTATKTAKKSTCCASKKKTCKKSGGMRYEKYQRGQKSNMFFVISMSILVASLLFADLIFINA